MVALRNHSSATDEVIARDRHLSPRKLTIQGIPVKLLSAFCRWLIKSPRYTGGDFMFLYRFVRRRRRRPQILVHAITFEQLFGFLSFLPRLLALTYRLTD